VTRSCPAIIGTSLALRPAADAEHGVAGAGDGVAFSAYTLEFQFVVSGLLR
jgi:hypothetical protein